MSHEKQKEILLDDIDEVRLRDFFLKHCAARCVSRFLGAIKSTADFFHELAVLVVRAPQEI